jgi:6,7-dimethyl-8-ribityllumazine synthase
MASGPHILIVEARFYDDIADELFEGAKAALEAAGATFERVQVPGVYEIPAAIEMGRKRKGGKDFDGFVALGCVIRGETSHYDVVAGESGRALMDLTTEHRIAAGNGILTTDTREQAEVRAARNGKNKGRDAAVACLSMIDVQRKFGLAGGK